MRNSYFFKIYIAFSIVYLIILLSSLDRFDLFLKPILIPVIGFGAYFYRKFPTQNTLLAALFFSWVGDVILLFTDLGEIYFILGLVAFLTAHILYCILFNKQNRIRKKQNKSLFIIGSILIALYLIGMVSFLMPHLGDLEIPVSVYASIISIMLLFAVNGLLVWEKPGNFLVFLGAFFFVVSDSILAVNKFYAPIPKSSFFIMLTYLLAQYLIVLGILKLNPKKIKE
ncbi:putative membrane protein YhhN [Flavobacterium nitrogenifigens]|uniref:Membrane protein YhhN n=2 Tax=Flavobacterium TaxID=237 RepID=A0ABR6QFD0_9FLAO|nr:MULTISPECIES: lysoplasmalogenase [Flavobacterium]MBB4802972.1 putative membrane protein YhhN [Flavobacterium nitrogenifigens]MBB6387930.1 putative membrane protein YhhN [Flavobacterium notoginsengisoli]